MPLRYRNWNWTTMRADLAKYFCPTRSLCCTEKRATRAYEFNLVINDCLLQSIPWEYLCAPGEQPLPSRRRGIARVVACRRPRLDEQSDRSAGPNRLRVLLAVSRESGDSVVPLEEMTAALRHKFELRMPGSGVELVVKSVNTAKALSDAVTEPRRPWDIIHYLGHGELQKSASGVTGGLRLMGDGGHGTFLAALKLTGLLSQKPPRMVLLTACNSAEAHVGQPFANIARALVVQGIPAVVANQMAIPADSVAEFCGGLYDQLLQSGDIDDAVSAARVHSYATLARGDLDTAAVEWGIPVLHRAPGAERLFAEFA